MFDDVNDEKLSEKSMTFHFLHHREYTVSLLQKKRHNDIYGKIHKQEVTSTYTELTDHTNLTLKSAVFIITILSEMTKFCKCL